MYRLGNDIHVWQLSATENEFPLLTEEEKTFAAKFRFEGDRLRFSAGRHGLRWLLSKYLSVDPTSIVISAKPGEKPSVVGHRSTTSNQQPSIYFNISHSGDWALIAIAQDEVGVDIEKINREFAFDDLLEEHFSEAERQYISQSEDPTQAFYYLWTRKEALTKAWGTGLQENLKTVSALPSSVNHTVSVHRSTAIGHLSSINRWKLETLIINQNYSAALACSANADQIILRPLPTN